MGRLPRIAAAALGLTFSIALSGCSSVSDVFGDDGNTPERDPSGNVTASSDAADVFALETGDCIGAFPEGEVAELPVMPCDEAHEMEIFAGFELNEGEYPGDDAVSNQANEGCVAEFEAFVGLPYDQSELYVSFLHPTEETWGQGDREVLCTVYQVDAEDQIVETSGTLRDAEQ